MNTTRKERFIQKATRLTVKVLLFSLLLSLFLYACIGAGDDASSFETADALTTSATEKLTTISYADLTMSDDKTGSLTLSTTKQSQFWDFSNSTNLSNHSGTTNVGWGTGTIKENSGNTSANATTTLQMIGFTASSYTISVTFGASFKASGGSNNTQGVTVTLSDKFGNGAYSTTGTVSKVDKYDGSTETINDTKSATRNSAVGRNSTIGLQFSVTWNNNKTAVFSNRDMSNCYAEITALSISFSDVEPILFSGGAGTSSDPYILANKSDVNELSANVAAGDTYENKYFKVVPDETNDSYSEITMATTSLSDNSFAGITYSIDSDHSGWGKDGEKLTNISDGNPSTKFCDSNMAAFTFRYDMSEEKFVDSFTFTNAADAEKFPGRIPQQFFIKGSKDGSNWVTVCNVIDSSKTWSANSASYSAKVSNPGNYRYFQVYVKSRRGFEINNAADGAEVRKDDEAPLQFADLWFSGPARGGSTFVPIGNATTHFKGHLDGNNCKIVYAASSSYSYVGLFGYMQDGSVKNLTVEGEVYSAGDYVGGIAGCAQEVSFIGTITSRVTVTGNNYVGGIVGYIKGGTVGTVTKESGAVSGALYVGGIFGEVRIGNGFDLTVTKAENKGTVTATSGGYAGGIAGRVFVESTTSSTITEAINSGAVTATGQNYVGGIIGRAESTEYYSLTINKSTNTASVTGASYVGGLVGQLQNTTLAGVVVNGTSDTGNTVTGTGNYVGGIVGYVYGGTVSASTVTNYMDVTGDGNYVGGIAGSQFAAGGFSANSFTNNGTVTGASYVGGIVGDQTHNLANGTNNGDVTASGSYVGGISGQVSGSATITACTNNGDVTASGSYVGGIAGCISGTGSMSSSTTEGAVSGDSYVGGYVGYYNSSANLDLKGTSGARIVRTDSTTATNGKVGGFFGWIDTTGTVTLAYLTNKGAVTITSDANSGANYVGGIAGYIKGNLNGTTYLVNDVSGDNTIKGHQYVGGIFGEMAGSLTGDLTNSTNNMSISGTDYVGGIVGIQHKGTVSESTNTGAVSATSNIGGISGRLNNDAEVVGCSNSGSITGTGDYVGGILGAAYKEKSNVTIRNATNSGAVYTNGNYVGGILGGTQPDATATLSGTLTNTGSVRGVSYVGGIVGRLCNATDAELTLTWTATVSIATAVINSGTVGVAAIGDYLGGVIGWLGASIKITEDSTIRFTSKDVDMDWSQSTNGGAIGGIVGYNAGTILATTSFTGGRILDRADSDTNVTIDEVAGAYVGGIVGYNAGTIKNATKGGSDDISSMGSNPYVGGIAGYNSGTIESCNYIANSTVNGINMRETTNLYSADYVGGIAGYNAGNIKHCYADSANLIVYGDEYVGGIAGYNEGTIEYTAFGGIVRGKQNVGGIVGYNTATINYSYCLIGGNVEGTSNFGGVVGASTADIENSWAFYNGSLVEGHNTGDSLKYGRMLANQVGGTILPSVDSNLHTDWAIIVSSNVSGFYFKSGVTTANEQYLSLEKLTRYTVSGHAKPSIPEISSTHTEHGGVTFGDFGYSADFDGNIRVVRMAVAGGFYDLVYDGTDKTAAENQTEAFDVAGLNLTDENNTYLADGGYSFEIYEKSADTVNVGTFTYGAHIKLGDVIIGCKKNGSATIEPFDINSPECHIFYDGTVFGGYPTYNDGVHGDLTEVTSFTSAEKGVIQYETGKTFYIYRKYSRYTDEPGNMRLLCTVTLAFDADTKTATQNSAQSWGTVEATSVKVDCNNEHRFDDRGKSEFLGSTNYKNRRTIYYYVIDSDYGMISAIDRNNDGKVESEWGSVDNPYVISHWIHLLRLSEIVNGLSAPINSVRGMGNTEATNKANPVSKSISYSAHNADGVIKKSYFLVTDAIDLNDMPSQCNFYPIGGWSKASSTNNGIITNYAVSSGTHHFGGVFDGQAAAGYSALINLRNHLTRAGQSYVGLFGLIKGVVLNDTIAHAEINNVTISANGVQGNDYVGSLIGKADSYVLVNYTRYIYEENSIITTQYINKSTINGANCVGGVVGYVGLGCEMYGEFVNNANVSGSSYVGGIIGQIMAGAGRQGTGANAGTYYLGEYTVDGVTRVSSMTNYGSVIGSQAYTGGVIGAMTQNVGSYNGVVTVFEPTFIRNKANVTGQTVVGGLVGRIELNNAIRLINTEDEGQANWSYNGDIDNTIYEITTNTSYAGGLFGVLSTMGHQIESVFSTAVVKTSVDSSSSEGKYIGGLVGYMNGGTFRYSFVSLPGNKTVDTATDMVRGNSYVGGLVGYMYVGTLDTCYVQGFMYDSNVTDDNDSNVTDDNDSNVTADKGGVVGAINTVTIRDTWALYLTEDPTYTTIPANTYGKYILSFSSSSEGAMSATIDEMLVFAGLIPDSAVSRANATGVANEIAAKEGSISIGVVLPPSGTVSDFKSKVQVVFYDGSGYEIAYADAFEDAANDSNKDNLFIRLNSSNDSFIIAKTGVRFGSITDYSSETAWESKYVSLSGSGEDKDLYKADVSSLDSTTNGHTGKYVISYSYDRTHNATPSNYANTSREITFNFTKHSAVAPRVIASQADWNAFASEVRSYAVVGEQYGLNQYVKLATNSVVVDHTNLAGDINAVEIDKQIRGKHFAGTFDGDGYTITVNLNAGSLNKRTEIGVFPHASNATFKNLTIEGTMSGLEDDCGGFVGITWGDLTFENCTSNITMTSNGGTSHSVGGILGTTAKYLPYTYEFIACVNLGNITVYESGSVAYGVGGIIGNVINGDRISSTDYDNEFSTPPVLTLESCRNAGNIMGSYNVGGIIGRTAGIAEIMNCGNTGNVDAICEGNPTNKMPAANQNKDGHAGGIIGLVGMPGHANIYTSYNSGTIHSWANKAGGIMGADTEYTSQANTTKIYYCYNIGTVIAGADKTVLFDYSNVSDKWEEIENGKYWEIWVKANQAFGANVGGILGTAVNSDLRYCYNAGDIVSRGVARYVGTVGAILDNEYHARAGGIIGMVDSQSISITSCYNVGDIIVDARHVDGHMPRYIGGIVGHDDERSGTEDYVNNCYSLKWQIKWTDKNGNVFRFHITGLNHKEYSLGSDEQFSTTDAHSSSGSSAANVLDSVAELTAIINSQELFVPSSDRVSSGTGTKGALNGESSSGASDARTLMNDYSAIKDGTYPGWLYVPGCLPQLAMFAVDTQDGLAMTSLGYGRDNMGEYIQQVAGSEFNPYIIKDGIDLLGVTALISASGGSAVYNFDDKYIEFANGKNNLFGDICSYIQMPIDTVNRGNDYVFYDGNTKKKGKSYHLYDRGANGLHNGALSSSDGTTTDIHAPATSFYANSQNSSGTLNYNASTAYAVWASRMHGYNGNSWTTGTLSTPPHTLISTNYNSDTSESLVNLFDGSTSTKFCYDSTDVTFVVEMPEPTYVVGYIWATGNDTESFTGRNPNRFRIWGSNDNQNWTALTDNSDPNKTWSTANQTYVDGVISNPGSYKYFKVQMNSSGPMIQLSEFKLTKLRDNFYPIGYLGDKSSSYDRSFRGNITGYINENQNVEIRGLMSYYGYNKSNVYAGLFGVVRDATVENITVTGDISACNLNSSDPAYAGVVAKALGNSQISGLQAGTSSRALNVSTAGGSVGYASGIVGMADSGASGNRLTIADSVVANATVNSHKGAVGGIVSYVQGEDFSSFIDITGCHVQKATLSTADNYSIGGIIGIQGSGGALSIRNCKVGDTSKKAPATANVIIRGHYALGGIIAYASTGADVSASFEDCYVYGDVLIEKTAKNNFDNDKYITSIGGITGAVVDNTDSFVTFRGDMEFYGTINLGGFTGVKNVGGVVGYMGTSARMEQSFVEVYGTINAAGCANSENIGGFAGISKGVCLDGAFAIAPTLTTDVSTNVGGFIGLNDGDTYITRTSLIYTRKVKWDPTKDDADGDGFPDQNELNFPDDGAGSVVAKEKVGGFIGANNLGCEFHMGAAEYKGAIYGEDGDLAYIELGSRVDGLRYIGGFLGYNAGKIFGEYCDVINTGAVGTASVPTEGYATIDFIGGVFGVNAETGEIPGEINISEDATFINRGQVGLKEYDLKDENGNLIKTYTFNGADEEGDETDSANQEFVGGIIGIVLGAITNNGSMQNMGDVYGYQYVGGAIGGLVKGTISGELSNGNGVMPLANADSEALVASDEAVSTAATGSSSVKAVVNVGGVIGVIMQDATISGATLTNYGSVTSTGDNYNVSNLGGAIGLNYGIIENSEFYNYGEITAKNFAGGAIGVNDGTIRNSDFVNSATITFTGDTALGGAVGYITNNYTTHGTTAYYPDNPALSAYEYNDNTRNFSTVTDSYFGYESIDNSKVVVQATGVDPYAFNANDDADSAFAAQGGLGGVFGAINSDDMKATGGWSGNTFFVYGDVYGGVFKSNDDDGGVYVDDATTPFTNQNFGGTVQAVGGVIGAIEVSYISIHNMLIYKSNVGGLRRVGGVVGFNGNANSKEGAGAAVDNCYNVYGNVIGTSTSVRKVTGSQIEVGTITVNYEDVGGIVGYIPTEVNVVTGEPYDPKTNASYWIKSYANELLQNSNPNNITETLDKASTWTEFLSYADYSNNVDKLDANGNPVHLPDGKTWQDYIVERDGKQYLKVDDVEYVQNANGDWGSYSEENVTIRYNTGTLETGYYYLFADDSKDFTDHPEGIVVDHANSTDPLVEPYASNESLNYWLIIVGSAKRAQQPDGTYYDEYESDSVHTNVGGAVKAGYIYSTAYASTENGFYLYVKDQGNATELNSEGDKIYISSNANNAGNIMIFYKEVVPYNNFVYNGYERYAQLVDINFSEDQPTEGVGEGNINNYFGNYYYTFNVNSTVPGKTTENGIGINRATIASNEHNIKATIWTVDSEGKPITLGSVDSTIDGANQYKWSIKKRNIEVKFDDKGHIADEEEQADAVQFDNTFSHYIKFTVSNIAIDVDADVSSDANVSSDEKIMAIINRIVTPKYSFNDGSESSLDDLKKGSVLPVIQVPQNSEVANVSFYAVGASSTSSSKNDTDNCYVYATDEYTTDEYKNIGTVKLYSATYIVYFKKAGAHKVSVTATDTNHRTSSRDWDYLQVGKRELKLEVNTSENTWKTDYTFDGGVKWQGVTSVVISNFIAGTLDDKTDYITTTGSTAGNSVDVDTSKNEIKVNFKANDAANYNAVVELTTMFKDSYYFVFKGTEVGELISGDEPSKWNVGWTIHKKSITLENIKITQKEDVYYNGQVQTIEFGGADGETDFTVEHGNEIVTVVIAVNVNGSSSTTTACNVGEYTVSIGATNSGQGSCTVEGNESLATNGPANYTINYTVSEGQEMTFRILPCPIVVNWKDVFNNKTGDGYVYDGNVNGPVIGSLTVGEESKTFSKGKADGVTKNETISLSVGYTIEKNASPTKDSITAYTKDFKVTGTNEVGDALASNYYFVSCDGCEEYINDIETSDHNVGGDDCRVEKTFSRAKSIISVTVTIPNGGIPDKVFDRTTAVGSINYDYDVDSSNSSKTCSITSRSLTGTFSDANVGSNKTVKLTFSADLSNTTNFEWADTKYTISGDKTATINARPLYIQLNNGANGSIYKTYDNSNEYASVTSDSGEEKRSTGIQWRTGRGILVSNFCTSGITVTASFLEVDQDERSDFDAYVNDIYVNASGQYVIGGTSATDTFYKKLRFALSGEGSTNYYIAKITDKSDNVLTQNADTGLRTLDLVDKADDNISIVIKKASVKATYSNTSQSYANHDNTYNTTWSPVEGQISTSKYKNLATVRVENGWMHDENGDDAVYKKYTRIAGSASGERFERLGATLTSDDGKHLCLTLRNQPTLIIGYFVEKKGGYEIGSMAGLLIASEYFKNNFNTSDEKGYDYIQQEIPFSKDNIIYGHSSVHLKVPENVYTQIANDQITTWEQLLAAVPEYDPRGYTHDNVEYEGANYYLRLCEKMNDETDEYLKEALQSQLDSFEFVYELIDASGEIVGTDKEPLHLVWWVPVEVEDTRTYNSFILVDNIDAILTKADIDMLTGAFGTGNYGVGKTYLPNVVFAEAGSVVIFNGPVFDYTKDAEDKTVAFNGIFDGDGYSIDHLTIMYSVQGEGEHNVGMFAEVGGVGSQVTAINLRNLNIQVVDTTESDQVVINVGGVAGKFAAYTENQIMEDVTVHGTISVKSTNGRVYAGGVIGSDSTGYDVDGGVSKVIDGAIVVATVRAEGAVAVAGGIIGITEVTTLNDVVSLSEVYAKGGTAYAGGFVGMGKFMNNSVSSTNHVDGKDFVARNSEGKTSAYLDSVFTITADGTYTKIAGGVSYDTLYCGSSTAYDDGIYLNAIEEKYGVYDMVSEKNAIAGKNTTGSMRLRDIVDTYVLGYELSAYTSGTGESAVATYRKSATSKYVGEANGVAYSTDPDTTAKPINIAYQQHLNLIRMFNYMNFTLNKDITMYTGYKLYMVDEAFTGTIEAKVKSDNSTPEVNVRSSESDKDFVDDDDDDTPYPQFFAYQDVNFTWLKKD